MGVYDYDVYRAMRDMEEQDAACPLVLSLNREALRLSNALYRAGRRDLEAHIEGMNRELLYLLDVGRDVSREDAAQVHNAFEWAWGCLQ